MNHARALLGGWLVLALGITACGQGRIASTGQAAGWKPVTSAKVKLRGIPAGYYDPAAGQSGPALLKTLNQIVANHTDLGYDLARDDMFGSVDDLDGDNTVTCVYIGRSLDRVTNRITAFRNGDGMNAEHSWPQSRGAVGVARDDLHHLFPADIKANGTRGSWPFGEVVDAEWGEGGSRFGSNAQGQAVFEPRADQKGDTARAIFYFYTVYGPAGGLDTRNFALEEPVLKRWNTQDPVSSRESARNDAIFEFQKNRNPYVDHPEYVAAVGTFLQVRPPRPR